MPLLHRSFAEALGTFALVFFGAGSVASRSFPDAGYGMLGIAIVHGLVMAVMVTALLGVSGGHLNPAVTLGLLVARRTGGVTAGAYLAAQLAGAVLAAFALKLIYPAPVGRAISLGTPAIASSIQFSQAVMLEAVMGFFLVSAFFGTCVNPTSARIGGLGVGLTLLFCMLVGGPLTGAAVNPARAFGPALVSGQWVAHGVYWVGPIVGGILAALVWQYVLLPRETSAGTK